MGHLVTPLVIDPVFAPLLAVLFMSAGLAGFFCLGFAVIHFLTEFKIIK